MDTIYHLRKSISAGFAYLYSSYILNVGFYTKEIWIQYITRKVPVLVLPTYILPIY